MTEPTVPLGEDAVAANLTAAGGTATEVDVAALIAQLQAQVTSQQAAISALQAKAGPQGENPLLATARMLRAHLADVEGEAPSAPGISLADDLVEAAGEALKSGDLYHVNKILGQLQRWAARTSVRPGEDYHGRYVREIIAYHLPDQVDAFTPPVTLPQVGGASPV